TKSRPPGRRLLAVRPAQPRLKSDIRPRQKKHHRSNPKRPRQQLRLGENLFAPSKSCLTESVNGAAEKDGRGQGNPFADLKRARKIFDAQSMVTGRKRYRAQNVIRRLQVVIRLNTSGKRNRAP